MPFGRRKGCHLRVIGAGLGWANVRVCARLPAGCRILYHLARLDRKTLERLIQAKRIRPTLKEREASIPAAVRGTRLREAAGRLARWADATGDGAEAARWRAAAAAYPEAGPPPRRID